jgi:hypothetical protein
MSRLILLVLDKINFFDKDGTVCIIYLNLNCLLIMEKTSFSTQVKFIFASACGAIVGTFVGLQFTDSLWWIAGIPAGGLTGWFLADPVKFIKTIPIAFKSSADGLKTVLTFIWKIILFPGFVGRNIKLNWKTFLAVTYIISNIGMFIIPIAIDKFELPFYQALGIFILSFPALFLVTSVCASLLLVSPVTEYAGKGLHYPKGYHASPTEDGEKFFSQCYKALPPVWMVLLVWEILKLIYLAGKELAKGLKNLFILTYSEIAFACMANAVIGTVFGYFFKHLLVGGLTGAGLGLVSFLIVDSVKKLKSNKMMVE